MAATIEELRAAILAPMLQQAKRKETWVVQGRYGEIIVRNKFLESGSLEVLDIPQDRGSKLDLTVKGGKRPDYIVSKIGADGVVDDTTAVCVDAKCRTIGADDEFLIGNSEMSQYLATMAHWNINTVIFAVVPADNPTQIILVGHYEMTNDSTNCCKVFRLTDVSERSLDVSREDHDRAIDQLRLEKFDASLAPTYP